MRWTRRALVAAGAAVLLPIPSRAQEATPAPSVAPASSTAPAVSVGASAAENQKVIEAIKKSEEQVLTGKGGVDYNPAGRRDPFVDPLKGENPQDGKSRPDGWPGMLIGEVQLQGLTVFGGEPIAIFRGTDSIGYFAREGDELWDGKIVSINFDTDEKTVVFQQKVEDPSSPVRFRDVVKKLHP